MYHARESWLSITAGLTTDSEILSKEAEHASINKDQEDGSECESSISDIDFDDISSTASTTSGTDGDTSLLDVLVDVLVETIIKKGGISSALFDDARSVEVESCRSDWIEEAFERGNDTSSPRGCKRKADTEDCGGRRVHD